MELKNRDISIKIKYTIFTRKNIYPFFLNVLDKGYILIEGKKKEKIEIAKEMLAKKFDISTIVEITKLTKEEVEELKEKN